MQDGVCTEEHDYGEIKGQQLQENREDVTTHCYPTVNANDEMQIAQDYEPGYSNIVRDQSQTIL